MLGGAPGVDPANVVILGGGVVGENAALIATGMKANVYIVDKSKKRLQELKNIFGDKIIPQLSDKTDLKKLVSQCDLLIGGVLNSRSRSPQTSNQRHVKKYEKRICYC